ncbi:MAG: hypothetical protein II467_01605, partial [Bacilli bacterium]|nr:hypothetical protein [Bacilli bacterium]
MVTLHFIAIRWMLFIVETLAACAPFFLYKSRRGHFYLRLGLGMAAMGGVIAAIAFGSVTLMETFNYVRVSQTIISSGGYFFSLLSVFALEIFLFKEKLPDMLSCLVQGFATRSTAFCCYLLLGTLLGNEWNFLNIAGMSNIANFFIYLGMYALVYFLIIFSTRKVIFRT